MERRVHAGGLIEIDVSLSDPTLRAALSTKPPSWSYEREWRYIERLGGDYEWPGPIVELIFGLRCPDVRRKHYLGLAQEYIAGSADVYEIVSDRNAKTLGRRLLRTIFGSGRVAELQRVGKVERLARRAP